MLHKNVVLCLFILAFISMAFEMSDNGISVESDSIGQDKSRSNKSPVFPIVNTASTTVCQKVDASSDDAEERVQNGAMKLTDTELELIRDGNKNQIVGMRFTGLNIPPGSTITAADLQFTVATTTNGNPCNLEIYGEKIGDAPTFTGASDNISSRIKTTATTTWSPPNWQNAGDAGPDQNTGDISAIIQEIVNHPGFTSSSAIVIIIEGTKTRVAESYDGDANASPELCVTYTATSAIQITSTATDETAPGASDGAIDITVAGGQPGYTYLWSNGATTEDISGLSGGSYTVTVTDQSGTTATHSATVNTIPAIQITSSVTDESAPGASDGAIDISVTGGLPGFTYLWSNGATTEDITGLSGGSYTVTVTDQNGTTDTHSATVNTNSGSGTFTCSVVSSSADDAEEGAQSGAVSLTSSDLELTEDYQIPGAQIVGMRFTGLNIPQGANITGADIQFTVDKINQNLDPCNLQIFGEDVDDASAFSTSTGDLSGRVKTMANVLWNPPDWVAEGDRGPAQKTTDIASIIQEIVNRTNYTSSSAIVILIEGIGTREAHSYNGNPALAPELCVIYDTSPQSIQITSMVTDESAPGASDGAIDITVTGGQPGYTYLWSNGATTEDITGLSGGSYTVTVTDQSGTTAIHTATVNTNSSIQITSMVTDESAPGASDGAIDISVTGGQPGYTYLWSNGATTEDLTGLSGGSYTVTVTDQSGTTATHSATVNTIPAIQITSSVTDESAPGASNGAIDISVTGGLPGFTYLWSNGATTEDITGLSGGAYTVTVTDQNGTTDTHSATVNTGGGGGTTICSTILSSTDDAEERNQTMYLTSTDLEIAVDGSNPQKIGLRFTGLNIPVGASITSANIQFTADENVNSDPCVITIKGEAIGDAPTFSGTDNDISLRTTTADSVIWSPPTWQNAGDAGAAQQTSDISSVIQEIVDLPGYTSSSAIVIIMDGTGTRIAESFDGGSNEYAELCVTYNPSNSIQISSTVTDESAPGASDGEIDISVTGGQPGYTYLWSNGATTEDITGLSGGSYTVTVTDQSGTTATHSATVNTIPAIQITSTVTDESAPGASDGAIDISVAGGQPGYTYLWSNGATTEDITGLSGGSYTVTVTDQSGTTATHTATVNTNSSIQITSMVTDESAPGASDGAIDISVTGGQPGYTYLWSNGATTEDLTGLSGGSYTVTVTDQSGTTATHSATVNTIPAIQITSSVTDESAPGASDGAIDISVTGGQPGYTYLWSNSATTEDITGLTGGTYTVTVTDQSGATATHSATVNTGGGGGTTICSTILSSTDDAEERHNGEMYLISTDLELVDDEGDPQEVGLRFTGLNIPPEASITSASIQFTADENTNSDPCILIFKGEATDDPPTFSGADNDISLRTTTADSVIWSPPTWQNAGDAGAAQQTSDISSVIQEIVDLPGYTSSSAIVIIITGTGTRIAESFDGGSNDYADLCVTYETPPPTSPPSNARYVEVKKALDASYTLPTETNQIHFQYIEEYAIVQGQNDFITCNIIGPSGSLASVPITLSNVYGSNWQTINLPNWIVSGSYYLLEITGANKGEKYYLRFKAI